ncbi:MAG: hypothetical protein ABIV13_01580 [Fimbriimonadales bacterium]
MRDWRKASAVASSIVCCATCVAQQTEHQRAVLSADRILSAEEFSYQEKSNYLTELLMRFFEWLDGLLGDASGPSVGGIGQILGILILAALAVGAVFFVAWLLSTRAEKMARSKFVAHNSERMFPAHELLKLSEVAEARGDHSRAFTLAYWAFLKLADEADVLRYSDDATNWEIVGTLTLKEFDSESRRFAILFDGIEYGHASADSQDVGAVRALIAKLDTVRVAA